MKHLSRPLVSIITPVYNGARFLPRLFECINSQRDISFEHIVVDDNSNDNSMSIIDKASEKYDFVKLIKFKENRGPVAARNAAISVAQGKYLAFLDVDDYWLPEKLAVQTGFMESTGATLSFTDYRFISEDGRLVGTRLRGPSRVGWSLHHVSRYLGCLTIMVNFERHPEFSFGSISPSYRAEDFLAWSDVISKFGPALRCKQDLARYAVVANSRSSGRVRAALSVWKLYRHVEKIPIFHAVFYFSLYCTTTLIKRWWFRPRFDSLTFEADIASRYLLRARND